MIFGKKKWDAGFAIGIRVGVRQEQNKIVGGMRRKLKTMKAGKFKQGYEEAMNDIRLEKLPEMTDAEIEKLFDDFI